MMRWVWCVALALGVCAGQVVQAAAPVAAPKARVRFLSLREAIALALEQEQVDQAHYGPWYADPEAHRPGTVRLYGVGPIRVLTQLMPGNAGIVVAGEIDRPRLEVERDVNQLLVNVEVAYWQLCAAYWGLHAREQGLRSAYEVWRVVQERYQASTATAAEDLQCRSQYEHFRQERRGALVEIEKQEKQLWNLLGLPGEDGVRLVPSDAPSLVPFKPDWETAADTALDGRPELVVARQKVEAAKVRCLLVQVTDEVLASRVNDSVRFLVFELLGVRPASADLLAWREPGRNSFGPIGIEPEQFERRKRHPHVWQALWQLARSMEAVQDNETKCLRFLGQQYRLLSTQFESVKANGEQRQAFAEQIDARMREYAAGSGALAPLLEAQRFWSVALAAEHESIALYNIARCGFEFAQGTLRQYHQVTLLAGPIPGCGAVLAVEHERERTRAEVARQRNLAAGAGPETALSLPMLWKGMPPLEKAGALPTEQELRLLLGAPASPLVEAKPEDIYPE